MDMFQPATREFPALRPFQVEGKESLRRGFAEGHRCQMVMAPTGAGKTIFALDLIRESLGKGKRAVFVCDRTTLINQTSQVADRFGLDHGVIQADHWRFRPWMQFQIASAQTLARREWPEADLIVIDEAHTQLKAWTEHIPHTKAAVIGLSATPFSKGLGKLFSRLINATTMHSLVTDGVLVPMRVMSCTPIDMRGAKTIGGEWTDAAAAERGMEIVGDVVAEWIKHASDRKTIVFGATIAHCEELVRQFAQVGVAAAVFTANTKPEERKQLLDDFTGPDAPLRVLVSVEALAKGFDVPDVSCVVDCRPLRKSLSTAVQMWGRGLRCAPEKTECLLLDHSGNIVRFAQDFEDVYFNGLPALDEGEKLDREVRKDDEDKPEPMCPSCGFQPFAKRCMACGHEHQPRGMVESLPGEMREIVIAGKKAANDQRDLWNQIATYVKRSHSKSPEWRARFIFRDITGHMPGRGHSVDGATYSEPSKALLNEIKRKDIAFYRRKAA